MVVDGELPPTDAQLPHLTQLSAQSRRETGGLQPPSPLILLPLSAAMSASALAPEPTGGDGPFCPLTTPLE